MKWFYGQFQHFCSIAQRSKAESRTRSRQAMCTTLQACLLAPRRSALGTKATRAAPTAGAEHSNIFTALRIRKRNKSRMRCDHERKKVAAGFMLNDVAKPNRLATRADESLETAILALVKTDVLFHLRPECPALEVQQSYWFTFDSPGVQIL